MAEPVKKIIIIRYTKEKEKWCNERNVKLAYTPSNGRLYTHMDTEDLLAFKLKFGSIE